MNFSLPFFHILSFPMFAVVPVITISALTGEGISGLYPYLAPGKTIALNRWYSRLALSTERLSAWQKDFPDIAPSSRVFVNLQTVEPIEYVTVIRLMDRLKKKTGIKKRLNPHIFRKSRITHMIAQNYQENIIKKSMWGNVSTEMFQTYVCLAEDDIDNEFLDRAGVQRKDNLEEIGLAPVVCPRCKFINSPWLDFLWEMLTYPGCEDDDVPRGAVGESERA